MLWQCALRAGSLKFSKLFLLLIRCIQCNWSISVLCWYALHGCVEERIKWLVYGFNALHSAYIATNKVSKQYDKSPSNINAEQTFTRRMETRIWHKFNHQPWLKYNNNNNSTFAKWKTNKIDWNDLLSCSHTAARPPAIFCAVYYYRDTELNGSPVFMSEKFKRFFYDKKKWENFDGKKYV